MRTKTTQEDIPQIYVPALHRELVRPFVPESVLFFDPGLPGTDAQHGQFTPWSYPLDRAAARQVLADLLSLGESLDLTSSTGREIARESLSGKGRLDTGEKKALAAFASATSPPHGLREKEDMPLIAAHKVLLLAWDLEERLLEIAALRAEVDGAAKPLAGNLADPCVPGHNAERHFQMEQDPQKTTEADWRLTLAAMAAFLPANAVLVTRHAGMRTAMLEAGMLLPLPEDIAMALDNWPESTRASMLWTKAPLWRVLGRAREPERAPWLLTTPNILVCSGKELA